MIIGCHRHDTTVPAAMPVFYAPQISPALTRRDKLTTVRSLPVEEPIV
jgi:hypothetical protein